MIDTLVLDEGALPKVGDNAPQVVKEFLALVGNLSSNPYKAFDFDKYAATANKFVTTVWNAIQDDRNRYYGGKENVGLYGKEGNQARAEIPVMLVTNKELAKTTVVPFLEWLLELEVPNDSMLSLRKGPENADVNKFDSTSLQALKTALAKYKDNDYSDLNTIFREVPNLLEHYARAFAGIMDSRPRNGADPNGLGGVKATRDKPIYEVCGEVVSEKLTNYSSAMGLVFGFMRDFMGRLGTVSVVIRENKRFAEKLETRKGFAIETLEKQNDALGEELRLTKEKRRLLMRQMESFAWPFDGAWTEEHVAGKDDEVTKVKIGFPRDKWATFVEVLEVNLDDLKTVLGFGDGAKLPPEIARLAVTYLAQIDPRVSLAVKSLDENSYNEFLVSFGKNPAVETLSAAVDALRKAPGDAELFAANADAKTEFDDIDMEVAKIDISPAKISRLVMNIFRKDE